MVKKSDKDRAKWNNSESCMPYRPPRPAGFLGRTQTKSEGRGSPRDVTQEGGVKRERVARCTCTRRRLSDAGAGVPGQGR